MTKNRLVLVPFDPVPANVDAIYKMLADEKQTAKELLRAPAWRDGGKGEYAELDPRNMISLKNGLLDITTRKIYLATPQFFTFTGLPLAYDFAAKAERWLSFLDEVTDHRQPLVDLLQEMFGYLLSGATRKQKMFFLMGDPGAGKGTILRILTALIGELNTCHPSIEGLGDRFGLLDLIGKSVAQITDLDSDATKATMSTAATAINAISGEDGITVRRHNIGPWNGRLGVRIVMAGNGLPDFGKHMNAMRRRLLVIPFDVSFEKRADENLTDKLELELAGILNWGLDGLDRLNAQGAFTEPEVSLEIKRRLLRKSNPLHGFIEENCELVPGATDKAVLYHSYKDYCAENGVRNVLAYNNFAEDLKRLYKIKGSRRRPYPGAPDDERIPCFPGIRLAAAIAAKVYKLDLDLVELGFTGANALAHDKAGFPIPLDADDRAHSDFAP
jgi:putative DNA primase/helicase